MRNWGIEIAAVGLGGAAGARGGGGAGALGAGARCGGGNGALPGGGPLDFVGGGGAAAANEGMEGGATDPNEGIDMTDVCRDSSSLSDPLSLLLLLGEKAISVSSLRHFGTDTQRSKFKH